MRGSPRGGKVDRQLHWRRLSTNRYETSSVAPGFKVPTLPTLPTLTAAGVRWDEILLPPAAGRDTGGTKGWLELLYGTRAR